MKLKRRTRTRDTRHRPERLPVGCLWPLGETTRLISISHRACCSRCRVLGCSRMLWPGLVRSVPAVSPRSRIMRRTRCTPPLFVLTTFLSDLPFAVTPARLFSVSYTVWTTSVSFSFFLFSFSLLWRTLQRPSIYQCRFFFRLVSLRVG